MKTYEVLVVEKLFRFPLYKVCVRAISKRNAKRKVFREHLDNDKGYLLFASRVRGEAEKALAERKKG